MDENQKSITEKPLMGTLIGIAITAAVIFVTVWAAGKGWKAGTKPA